MMNRCRNVEPDRHPAAKTKTGDASLGLISAGHLSAMLASASATVGGPVVAVCAPKPGRWKIPAADGKNLFSDKRNPHPAGGTKPEVRHSVEGLV